MSLAPLGPMYHYQGPLTSVNSPTIPRPQDANIVARLLSLVPKEDLTMQLEYNAYSSQIAAADRVRSLALYSGALRTFGYLWFLDNSVTPTDMVGFVSTNGRMDAPLNKVLSYVFSTSTTAHTWSNECSIYRRVKTGFSEFLGCAVVADVMPDYVPWRQRALVGDSLTAFTNYSLAADRVFT